MPNIVVTSLLFDERNNELLAGTFGRSIFSTTVDDGLLFHDSFESADTDRWAAAVP